MITTKEYFISSCDDFELNIKRKSKLRFLYTYDDKVEPKAILTIIAGLGEDAQKSYKEHLASSIAEHFKGQVAVLSVDYFCVALNPAQGAKPYLDERDIDIFLENCARAKFRVDDDFRDKAKDFEYANLIIDQIDSVLDRLKARGEIAADAHMSISVSFAPPNGEYQNFGVMSAIDVINALLYVKKDFGLKELPCVLVGSSHGAYIANLAAKIAPWAIAGVIDNAAWNLKTEIFDKKLYEDAAFRTISFGKEMANEGLHRAHSREKNFLFCFSDTTKWTSDESLPNYFSRSRYEIRDVAFNGHLASQAGNNKPIYVGYHSSEDNIANLDDKIAFYESLKALGYDATLHVINKQSQVDGKFIKNLGHGINMSIKTLILKELPPLLEKLSKQKKSKAKKQISYKTDEWIYSFKEFGSKIIAKCEKI